MSQPSPTSGKARSVRFGVRAIGRTDVGRQREANEDAMFFDDHLGLFLVCDGMGGHASGQVASEMATKAIVESMVAAATMKPTGEEPLALAMKAANRAVYQRSLADPACHGMGTTAVGVRVDDETMHVCHCGDSRLYLLRGGQLAQITRDHSLANLYQDKPELKERMGPATSNVIVRAIGLDENVEIDHRTVTMEDGDLYLLCCDGLTDLVADWMIREIMTSGESLEAIGDNLIRAANANGGTDNITVVLISTFTEAVPDLEEVALEEQSEYPGTRPGF